jgi:hypothetical protein
MKPVKNAATLFAEWLIDETGCGRDECLGCLLSSSVGFKKFAQYQAQPGGAVDSFERALANKLRTLGINPDTFEYLKDGVGGCLTASSWIEEVERVTGQRALIGSPL